MKYIYFQWIRLLKNKIAAELRNIGFKAGIIFEKLGETGLITIAELARRLNFAADETALAAGWLARENKIYIERRNGLLYIRKE